MNCPVCRRGVADEKPDLCPRCGAELSKLYEVRMLADKLLRRGKQLLCNQRLDEALQAFSASGRLFASDEALQGQAVVAMCKGDFNGAFYPPDAYK